MNTTTSQEDFTQSTSSGFRENGTDIITNGVGNMSSTNLDTTTTAFIIGIDSNTSTHILNGLIVLSALTIVVNIVVLIMSKFATGGKSATFVFLRSLCMADMLIGMYGIFKCILLNNLQYRLINCFLPESLFISASTVICVTLFWLNIDSYLRLSRPLGSINTMDKHCVIITMVFLWNMAFIVGFAPLMGWNDQDFVCDLFQFYNMSYAVFVSLIWLACIIGCCVTHVLVNKTTQQIRANNRFISPRSLEFMKYTQLTSTIRNDLITLAVCYLPFLVYLFYYYTNHRHRYSKTANINLIYFLPIFLARSLISAFIHSYRTIRIQHVLHDISKHMNVSLFLKCTEPNGESSSNGADSNSQSHCNSLATLHTSNTSTSLVGAAGSSDINTHKKLCASDSTVTIIVEEKDLEMNTTNSKLTKL